MEDRHLSSLGMMDLDLCTSSQIPQSMMEYRFRKGLPKDFNRLPPRRLRADPTKPPPISLDRVDQLSIPLHITVHARNSEACLLTVSFDLVIPSHYLPSHCPRSSK